MSTKFFLAPYERSEWEANEQTLNERMDIFRITAETFEKNVLLRWPQAQVHSSPFLPFTCELPSTRSGFGGLGVSLMPNLQVVSFGTGPMESFLEFVFWYRSLVPNEYRLFLFNSAASASLEISVNSTEQEIVEFTGMED